MESPLLAILISILGGGSITALIVVFFGQRKTRADILKTLAEVKQIESTTQQTETRYYEERLEGAIVKLRAVEDEVKQLKSIIEKAQAKYEQRLGTLHNKIDSLVAALERANAALDVANNTIVQLRQEVKDGNIIITELRKEISQLLVKQAEGRK